MTKQAVMSLAKAVPFTPFYVKMADGSVHTIQHPELIAVGKRLALAFAPDGETVSMLDLNLMTEAGPLAGGPKRRSR
jgi:hypothetical protein